MGNLANTTTENQCQILQTVLLQGVVVGHEYAKAVLGIGSGFRTRVSNLRRKGLPIKANRLSILNSHTGRHSHPYEYYLDADDIAKIKAERQGGTILKTYNHATTSTPRLQSLLNRRQRD